MACHSRREARQSFPVSIRLTYQVLQQSQHLVKNFFVSIRDGGAVSCLLRRHNRRFVWRKPRDEGIAFLIRDCENETIRNLRRSSSGGWVLTEFLPDVLWAASIDDRVR